MYERQNTKLILQIRGGGGGGGGGVGIHVLNYLGEVVDGDGTAC